MIALKDSWRENLGPRSVVSTRAKEKSQSAPSSESLLLTGADYPCRFTGLGRSGRNLLFLSAIAAAPSPRRPSSCPARRRSRPHPPPRERGERVGRRRRAGAGPRAVSGGGRYHSHRNTTVEGGHCNAEGAGGGLSRPTSPSQFSAPPLLLFRDSLPPARPPSLPHLLGPSPRNFFAKTASGRAKSEP